MNFVEKIQSELVPSLLNHHIALHSSWPLSQKKYDNKKIRIYYGGPRNFLIWRWYIIDGKKDPRSNFSSMVWLHFKLDSNKSHLFSIKIVDNLVHFLSTTSFHFNVISRYILLTINWTLFKKDELRSTGRNVPKFVNTYINVVHLWSYKST